MFGFPDDPPTQPQIQTTMGGIIQTPEKHFRIYTVTSSDIDQFDNIAVDEY